MDYLSEIEKSKVEQFLADTTMKEAVRKVLLSGVYFNGVLEKDKPADPLKNFILAAFTNQHAQLLDYPGKGMKIEAIVNAISLIETGFQELEKCKTVGIETEEKPNPAR